MGYTIIVGFDDSEASRAAIDMAVVMAKKFEGRIVVASGLAPNYDAPAHPRAGVSVGRDPQGLRAWYEGGHRRLWRRLPAHGGRGVPLAPVQALVGLAEERGADLIVVGASGEGRVRGLLLGSTAFGVVQRSPVPVLVVPAPV